MAFTEVQKNTLSNLTQQVRLNKNIKAEKALKSLKKGVWLYLILLIIEGALRKWVLPGLSNPLLIIRDPLAIWLIYKSWQRGLLPINSLMVWMVIIGFVSIFTTLIWGHGNLLVALFGARLLLVHFPVIFVIGKVFTREDVIQMGVRLLWISIPMTLLIAAQFYSPQSAWVNRGIGGDLAGGGFSAVDGFFRPPVFFYGLVAVFIFYFWLSERKEVSRLLLLASTLCLVASIPLSISRSLVAEIAGTVIFVIIATGRKPQYLLRILAIGAVFFCLLLLLNNYSFFQVATSVITSRFETASSVEGGARNTIVNRFFGGMIVALTESLNHPFFGLGLGLGSNAGSQLLSGKRGFTISEEEWGRIIGEMGPFLGLGMILIRVILVSKMGILSYKRVIRGDLLSWLLLSFGGLIILQGQWAQPTSQGFATLIGGLILAALKAPVLSDEQLNGGTNKI
jgi:hypothetical protein